MLRAVAKDLAQIPGALVRTLLNPCFASPPPGCHAETLHPDDEERTFRRLARWADFSLIIAPEFDGLLHTRCRWVEEEKGQLFGPSSQAVSCCADKLTLSCRLRASGVPMPECCPASQCDLRFPVICKPRCGAGSQATFLVGDRADLAKVVETAAQEGWAGEMMCQRFVPGYAASVAFLIGPKETLALVPAAQHLSEDGRFRYGGGSVPLAAELAERAIRVARSAVDSVSGLRGYIGVDVVLGETDWVMEINPRLTTSYLGLRALAEANLGEMMVRIVRGEKSGPPPWRPGVVHFSPLAISSKPTDGRPWA